MNKAVYTTTDVAGGCAGAVVPWAGAMMPWAGAVMPWAGAVMTWAGAVLPKNAKKAKCDGGMDGRTR